MTTCQSCLLDLIKACLNELADRNPILNTDELSLENALLANFDGMLGLYLDPIWHQLSGSARNLVSDIGNLRRLLKQLLESDAVSFLTALETHRQAALANLGGQSLRGSSCRSGRDCPSWFLMDQADRLLVAARDRVFSNYTERKLNVELSPKWSSLVDILNEFNEVHHKYSVALTEDVSSSSTKGDIIKGVILILVGNESTARLLEQFLHRGKRFLRQIIAHSFCNDDRRQSPLSKSPVEQKSTKALPEICVANQLHVSRGKQPTITTSTSAAPNSECYNNNPGSHTDQNSFPAALSSRDTLPSVTDNSNLLPLGCRQVLVCPQLLQGQHSKTFGDRFRVIIRVTPRTSELLNEKANGKAAGITHSGGTSTAQAKTSDQRLAYVMDALQPRMIVLYDPKVTWVREIEVYQARRCSAAASMGDSLEEERYVQQLDVIFMVYAKSVEEQRYLTTLRREKEAFESLIELSTRIVLPKDITVSTMAASDNPQQPRVFVDMREFRSELPAILHRKGLKVEPRTLSIGDYILAPHLCVERKSVSDLIGSLNSGRLYQQCTAMSRHYLNPILLIEFSLPTKSYQSNPTPVGFSLYIGRHSISSDHGPDDANSRHLLSRLCLLTICFPNLRLIWSLSSYNTSELFAELKQGRAEPAIDKLPQDGEHLEDHNIEAVDMLLNLPGISWKNYRRLMNRVSCLFDVVNHSLDELVEILGDRENAKKLYNFLHSEFRTSGTTDTICDSRDFLGHAVSAPSSSASTHNASQQGGRRCRDNTQGLRFSLVGRVKTRRERPTIKRLT